MSSAYCSSLWGQCYDLWLLQLVRLRVRNVMWPKKDLIWLPVCTGQGFFMPDGTDIFQDDNVRINWVQIVKEWFWQRKTSFSHMDWLPESPELNPIEELWDVLEKFTQWSNFWWNINTTLDGEKPVLLSVLKMGQWTLLCDVLSVVKFCNFNSLQVLCCVTLC